MVSLLAATASGLIELSERGRRNVLDEPAVHVERDGDILWLVTDEGRIYKSDTGGMREVARSALPWKLRCLAVKGTAVTVGTAHAHLLEWGQSGLSLMESFESAPTRDRWYTPWGGPPDVRSMAWGQGRLYVNVHVGGILALEDRVWRQTIDLQADVHQVLTLGDAVLAASARGLAHSADQGRTWHFDTAGLHASYLRAVGVCDDTVLVSVSNGPRGGSAAVYRGFPARGWTRCREGLPDWFDDNIDTHCLIGRGGEAALATSTGAVYTSGDQGQSWDLLAADVPPVRAIAWAS
ncbi:MAG TPA: hypothetical protein VIL12_00180 [Acidimicrobiia bacterium]